MNSISCDVAKGLPARWTGWLVVIALCCVATAISAAPLPGHMPAQVIYVTDGDTVVVRDANRKKHAVRIVSIDAPEKGRQGKPGQRYSEKSRRYLAGLIDGKRVNLVTRGRDDYGRVLARVWIGDADVGLAQVCAGYAWVFEAFVEELPVADQQTYRNCQVQAKANRRGLWRDTQPMPPWIWRYQRRDVSDER